MKTKYVDINLVNENPDNPRVIEDRDFAALVKSIQEFPKMLEIRPIVVTKDYLPLGGNMRLRAAKEAGLEKVPVLIADELTEDEQRRFIITDNVSRGKWDWEKLATDWDADELTDLGVELPGIELDHDDLGTEFELPSGEKPPFQQMTFTLADEQAEQIKNAIEQIKQTDEYKFAETMGNENSNGNALYVIVMQWMQTHN